MISKFFNIRFEKKSIKFVVFYFCFLIGCMVIYFNGCFEDKIEVSEEIALNDNFELHNMIYDDGIWKVEGEDPHMIIYKDFGRITGIRVKFIEEIKVGPLQLYYANGDEFFTEFRTDIFKYDGYIKECQFVIPYYDCTKIRLDINSDVEIESIEFIGVEIVKAERTSKYIITSFLCLILSCLLGFSVYGQKILINYIMYIKKGLLLLKGRKKIIFISFCIILGTVVCAIIVERFINIVIRGMEVSSYLNVRMIVLLFTLQVIVIMLYLYRKGIIKKQENIAGIILFGIGLIMAIGFPAGAGISWDDEIHFSNAVKLSRYLEGEKISVADRHIVNNYNQIATQKSIYGTKNQIKWGKELGELYDSGVWESYDNYKISIYSVAYIPSAVAMIFSRGIGLPYSITFILGRVANLSFYIVILWLAMRKISSGKLLVALIGGLPTNLFLATSYSYDYWVNSLTILGLAYFFEEVFSNKNAITFKKFLPIVVILFIGFMPKAVYFSILLILILSISRNKFDKKDYYKIILLVVFTIFVLVASFCLPLLFPSSSGGVGDVRGGSDVDGMKQITYILSNPLKYANTLLRFLLSYFSLENSRGLISSFAYVGTASCYIIFIVLIFIANYIDNNKYINPISNKVRIITWGICFCTMCLTASALYVSFTPVAANTIYGCQPRYLIPIIFPVVYVISSNKIKVSKSERNYTFYILLVYSFAILYNLWKVYFGL